MDWSEVNILAYLTLHASKEEPNGTSHVNTLPWLEALFPKWRDLSVHTNAIAAAPVQCVKGFTLNEHG